MPVHIRTIARQLIVLSCLSGAAFTLHAKAAVAAPCIVCPAVVPECRPSCLRCVIIPQTCERCARALCLDAGLNVGESHQP